MSGALPEVVSPTCPAGRVVTGGGAFLLSPSSQAADGFVLRRSYPRGTVAVPAVPVVWVVQAVITGTPFFGDYTVTSYVLCTGTS
jgi:hypothetical protein